MLRRSILICGLTLWLPLAASFPFAFPATAFGSGDMQAGSPDAVEVTDLKQQLEKGLRARRPQEFAFVNLVVTMVADNELPLALVKSTFLWARKKALTTRYPFPYFERALRERAAKLGIEIPTEF